MPILPLVLTIVLTVAALAYALWPLRQQDRSRRLGSVRASAPAGNGCLSARDDLLTRRAALYTMLQDAEFDREMGKLGDADYQALRSRAMREAAQVLQQLDRLTPEAEAAVDREIEQAVARLRSVRPDERLTTLPAAAAQAVEADIAALVRHAGVAVQEGRPACPNCGQAYRAGDSFCVYCGSPLPSQGGDKQIGPGVQGAGQ